MPVQRWSQLPSVRVDGAALSPALEAVIHRVEVDSDVVGPGTCRIVLRDPSRTVLGDGPFDFQRAITVSARDGQDETQVFDGTIVSLGFEFDSGSALTTVTAYDRTFGLFNGAHITSYQSVTDADIATRIGGELGLDTSGVQASPIVHDHIGQFNETHWEFLNRRAAEIDFEVRIDGRKLLFGTSTQASTAPAPGDFDSTDALQLTPGTDLLRFSARVTSAGLMQELEVRGWDVANKQALSSTSSLDARSAATQDDAGSVAVGSTRTLAPPLPLATQAECDAHAAAQAQRMASTSLHAEGIALGNPALRAGAAVSVGQAGHRMDGRFTLTRARHVWSGGTYRVHFVASGPHDRSLLGLVAAAKTPSPGGCVVGLVSNAADPEALGRVKLKFPWLSDEYESDWTRVATPGAGDQRGLLLIPEVDDEVLVAFEHGDLRRPVVLAAMFNGVDKPASGAVDASSGKVVKRSLTSRNGHNVTLDDTDGSEQVSVTSSDGTFAIVLDIGNNAVAIKSGGDLRIDATGDLTLNCRNLTINASGDGSLKSTQNLTLQANAQLSAKAQQILLN